MTNEEMKPTLKNNEQETNVQAKWQGRFRTSFLDIDQLQYALEVDKREVFPLPHNKKVWVTCADQVDLEKFPMTKTEGNTTKILYGIKALKNFVSPHMTINLSTGPETLAVRENLSEKTLL